MSAVYMSFLGIIVLIARECSCEWQRDFGDGNESVFTIRYDTRCYFNVRSKADISQLNLPHDAILSRYMLWPCVVCLCSAKTNKQRITQQQ